jgi:RecA/RadA recombinase
VKYLQRRVSTGCSSLDKLLGGGLPSDGVSLIYGEAETGKSSLATQCAVNCARAGLKSIFIDSDGTFSSRRLSQIAHHDHEEISPLIILIKPSTFQEQVEALDHLENYITKKVGLLVVDTVTSLYRVELGDRVGVEPVARRVLRFWSKVVLNLEPTGQRGIIKAVLEKHPTRKRRASCYLTINKTGIQDYESGFSTRMDG